MEPSPVSIDVEVCLLPTSTLGPSAARKLVSTLLERRAAPYTAGPLDLSSEGVLSAHVRSARVCELPAGVPSVEFWRGRAVISVYSLSVEGPTSELGGGEGEGGGDESVASYTHLELPNASLEGLWESLVFDASSGLKEGLLAYAQSGLAFSDAGVGALGMGGGVGWCGRCV